jgi:hypothetical protein
MLNNSTNINKANNQLASQPVTIEKTQTATYGVGNPDHSDNNENGDV